MSKEAPPRASILLVDDHPANLLALEAILAPLGHQLVCAHSGDEALKKVLAQELALIIMDVQMPGLDGFATASLIKQRERSRHIPIIFLTALSKEAAHVFAGYAHGAVDYMMKPFDPHILRSKVAVFVELWQRGELLKAREAALRELERERLERESAARHAALIEAMPQGVVALRPSGEVTFCNSVWRDYVGGGDGDGLWAAAHPDERLLLRAAWVEAQRSGRGFARETRLKRRGEDAWRWHLVQVVPERGVDGALVGFIATATDVHGEKQQRDEVERASRAKDEFLATLSHELRNPLNAILGWTRMLRAGKLDGDRAARALETVERNAALQAALVEDMLDVSRIITGKLMLKIGAVDVRQVVSAACDTVRMAAEAKQIELAVALDDDVDLASGDPDRLQQVVWNLLSNAIKFTPRGGRVDVVTRRDGSHVELVVRDSGQGITADFLPYVFDRFRQADSTSTRVHGGLGLGLAIVRHLVELHGGTVRVASDGPGTGATFTVRLPLRAVLGEPSSERRLDEPGAPAAALGDAQVLAGAKLLVVDDEPDARELLAAVLEHHGAAVIAAASVAEAIAAVARDAPDLVVSDIGMPGEDGYALIARLRGGGATLPVIALTGFARPEDGERALAAGFSGHLAKPVDPLALVEAVERFLRERGREVATSLG